MSDTFDHEWDAWESRLYDDNPDYTPRRTKCKYCQARNLEWSKLTGKWRMINQRGEPHTCEEFKIANQRGR